MVLTRPNWDEIWMDFASNIARRSPDPNFNPPTTEELATGNVQLFALSATPSNFDLSDEENKPEAEVVEAE